jgi:chemotaxis protein methyltransferase CheR
MPVMERRGINSSIGYRLTAEMAKETQDPYLEKIIDSIQQERSLDFSQYKKSILSRRVMTRVRASKRDNFEQYLAYLKLRPEEINDLLDALTINVTGFFRDAIVFDAIENKILPEIVEKKRRLHSNTVRFWSCGCSSGEEPYSLLMLVAEYLGSKLAHYHLTIDGTDIDKQSLAKAREGVYEESQFKNLALERKALLDEYFYDLGNKRYRIRGEWPAYLDFRYHDVIADRPLEHMDLILCRNVFIYFSRELQDRILEKFLGALNTGGFLILGNVESIFGPSREKFVERDRTCHVYQKK